MKVSPTDDFVPVYSVFEPLTIVAYCATHSLAVRDKRTLLSMARNREYVDHDFEGRNWKIYVKEEVEERIREEGKVVYKRILKRYLEINCPLADGLIIKIIERYLEIKLVKISLRSMDEWGGYTPMISLEKIPGDTMECIKKERREK